MGVASTGRRFATGAISALAAMLVVAAPVAVVPASSSYAQGLSGPVETGGQMLLEADTLTYDNDTGVVTAAGNVRIDYNGIRLVAQRVSFYRESKRLVAYGNVQMVDRDGNKSFADEIDVTDNLRTGFVNALRIETTDKTYFASESAEQQNEDVTRFNNGVYTACEPCSKRSSPTSCNGSKAVTSWSVGCRACMSRTVSGTSRACHIWPDVNWRRRWRGLN